MNTIKRMQALRCSHCVTCGCDRCKRIDGMLVDEGRNFKLPEDDEQWLFEG